MLLLLLSFASVSAPNAAAYVNQWAGVRGVNYVPSYSANPVETWMDYNRTTIERELGYAKDGGFNAVRMFMSVFAYIDEKETFLSNYDHFVSSCAARGIKPLVVVFDDDFYDVAGVNTTRDVRTWLAKKLYPGAKWMRNPGMPILLQDYEANWTLCTGYLNDLLGGARANDPRLLGVDIMNEPHAEAAWPGGLPHFIGAMVNFTKTIALKTLTTVDAYSQAPSDLDAIEGSLSYHSYWEYGKWTDCETQAATVCTDQEGTGGTYMAAAKALNKNVLVSEMGQFNCYCPSAHGLTSAGVGWIAWELMLEHDQFSKFQGMVYKNGTWRSDAERACLKAMASPGYVSKCPPRPPPAPPQPPAYPGPDGCAGVQKGCVIMPAYNTSYFAYGGGEWTAWNGNARSPSETHGTLHYCNTKGCTSTFTLASAAENVHLIYKAGPDCGIMDVTATGGGGGGGNPPGTTAVLNHFDTFSPTVNWESIVALEAHVAAGRTYTITVSGAKNAKSANAYIQIVSANIFAAE